MLQKAACAVNAHARHAAIGGPLAVVCKKASRNLLALRPSKPTDALITHDFRQASRGFLPSYSLAVLDCPWMPFPNRAHSGAGRPHSERRGGGRAAAKHY